MELEIEVTDKKSERVAASLKSLLADEYVLRVRTQDAHRNIYGSNVIELRKLFEDQYESLDVIVVDISRKARAFGQLAPATFRHSMEATRLSRHNEKFKGQGQIIEALLDDHESMIHALSEDSPGDADEKVYTGTVDFMAGLLRQHLEMAGALRGWLQ